MVLHLEKPIEGQLVKPPAISSKLMKTSPDRLSWESEIQMPIVSQLREQHVKCRREAICIYRYKGRELIYEYEKNVTIPHAG